MQPYFVWRKWLQWAEDATTPVNGLVAEDGKTPLVAEDDTTFLVQE